MDYEAVLAQVLVLLQREQRVAYRVLKRRFQLDDETLEDLKDDLIYAKKLAVDEEGRVLVWTGGTSSAPPPVFPVPPPATSDVTPAPVGASPIGPATPDAERRQLTVLFCDLVGSTSLSGQLDPEDLRTVVRAYQEAAAAVIARYEGHIAQYLGDGLLVYFGYPTAHEDEARRAVHTGLGIVEAIATLSTRLTGQYGVHLAVRLGIHTGPVVVGVMGGGGRHEHLALGETPNVAARLQNLAPANAVVVSAATARLVQGTFALDDLGTHTLHGVTEPLAVSRVRGPLATPSHDEEFVTAVVPMLVGREEESGLLRRRWEQSKAGLGQVVLISGEAGIGKSALVEGLLAQVRAEGLPRLAYRCSPYHTNSVLYPVITHIEHLLHFERGDTPATKLDKLAQGLQGYRLPLEEVVPLLAALLSVPLDERYPALRLTPHQQKQQTLDTLVACLFAEAERQPVLVTWEDLHWADPTMVELLGLVLEQTPTVPMLSILTFRPEFSPPWPTRSQVTPLALNHLERPQVAALIRHLAGGKTLPADVVEHIVAKTDGVPLFVEELTKMLLESPLLREEAQQYVLTGPLLAMSIPDTLQDSLMARLDRLNAAKEVAQLGAVVGREFSYEMLLALSSQDEETLKKGLAQLVEAELLYQRGRPPRARYLFKHALVQDTAYTSLLRSTRRHYHAHIAQLLEARFPETVATEPELVAHHYTEAGLVDAALPYWQRAGERANDRSANTEARSHLTKGLALLTTVPESPPRLHAELVLQTTLGRVLTAAKGYGDPEVAQVYTRARQLCQQLDDTPQLFPVLLGLSIYFVVRAELRTARELGAQLLSLAQGVQDPVLLVEAHYALGVTCFWLGEFAAARAHLEQGIAHYDPAQHAAHLALYGQDGGLVCLCRLALVLWYLGYPDQALAQGDKARTIAEELAHPFSWAYVLTWLAFLHNHCRTAPETQQWVDAATTFATEQGFPYWSTQGMVLQGWLLTEQGQVEQGIQCMRHGLAEMQAIGTEVMQAYARGLLAAAYGKTQQPQHGRAVVEEALTKIAASGERWPEADLHRVKGELLLQEGAPAQAREAEASLRHALHVARGQQAKLPELRAALRLSRLWQQQGKREDAFELLAPIYGWFTEGFDTADLQDAKALLDELGG